ncbi:hypothetical protein B7463_g6784, partial [Scytalidium lignicola]
METVIRPSDTHPDPTLGEEATSKTDDPERRPLPSKDLLDMQWVLHRLAALAGGAEAVEYSHHPDDDPDEDQFATVQDDQWDEQDYRSTTDSSDNFSRELKKYLVLLTKQNDADVSFLKYCQYLRYPSMRIHQRIRNAEPKVLNLGFGLFLTDEVGQLSSDDSSREEAVH